MLACRAALHVELPISIHRNEGDAQALHGVDVASDPDGVVNEEVGAGFPVPLLYGLDALLCRQKGGETRAVKGTQVCQSSVHVSW